MLTVFNNRKACIEPVLIIKYTKYTYLTFVKLFNKKAKNRQFIFPAYLL